MAYITILRTEEIRPRDFDFWSGARSTADELTDEDWDVVEDYMECNQSEWDETEVNDFLWFNEDTIAELLGYENWDDLIESRRDDS